MVRPSSSTKPSISPFDEGSGKGSVSGHRRTRFSVRTQTYVVLVCMFVIAAVFIFLGENGTARRFEAITHTNIEHYFRHSLTLCEDQYDHLEFLTHRLSELVKPGEIELSADPTSEFYQGFVKAMYVCGQWHSKFYANYVGFYEGNFSLVVSGFHPCDEKSWWCTTMESNKHDAPPEFQNTTFIEKIIQPSKNGREVHRGTVILRNETQFTGTSTPGHTTYIYFWYQIPNTSYYIIAAADMRLAMRLAGDHAQGCLSMYSTLDGGSSLQKDVRDVFSEVSVNPIPELKDAYNVINASYFTINDVRIDKTEDLEGNRFRFCGTDVNQSFRTPRVKYTSRAYIFFDTPLADDSTPADKKAGTVVRFDIPQSLRRVRLQLLTMIMLIIVIGLAIFALALTLLFEFRLMRPLDKIMDHIKHSILHSSDMIGQSGLSTTEKERLGTLMENLLHSNSFFRSGNTVDEVSILGALVERNDQLLEEECVMCDGELAKLREENRVYEEALFLLNHFAGRNEDELKDFLPALKRSKERQQKQKQPLNYNRVMNKILTNPYTLELFKQFCNNLGKEVLFTFHFIMDVECLQELERGNSTIVTSMVSSEASIQADSNGSSSIGGSSDFSASSVSSSTSGLVEFRPTAARDESRNATHHFFGSASSPFSSHDSLPSASPSPLPSASPSPTPQGQGKDARKTGRIAIPTVMTKPSQVVRSPQRSNATFTSKYGEIVAHNIHNVYFKSARRTLLGCSHSAEYSKLCRGHFRFTQHPNAFGTIDPSSVPYTPAMFNRVYEQAKQALYATAVRKFVNSRSMALAQVLRRVIAYPQKVSELPDKKTSEEGFFTENRIRQAFIQELATSKAETATDS